MGLAVTEAETTRTSGTGDTGDTRMSERHDEWTLMWRLSRAALATLGSTILDVDDLRVLEA